MRYVLWSYVLKSVCGLAIRGVSIMEDEGTADDHNSGFGSTDGRWHHIAVTWSSATGVVRLYDNGRPQWVVARGLGQSIPAGGTLVIGREQVCTAAFHTTGTRCMQNEKKICGRISINECTK